MTTISTISPPPTPTEPSIDIIGDLDEQNRGFLRRLLAKESVPVGTLKARLDAFLAAMGTVFESLPDAVGAYQLDSLTMAVEVSAKGNISLLGAGGEVGGKSGLTFTFKRKIVPTAGSVTSVG
jgi:hypothetical protein